MIQNIRQVRRKETSLSHPSTSLHLMHLCRFLQDYNHSRLLHNINLNAASVQAFLPTKEPVYLDSMDLIKDVPYIQSEHYDSSHTFATEADPDRSSSDENFTDEEEIIQDQRPMPKQRKFVMLQEEDEFREQDFQFVANKRSNKDSVTTFPHSSTIYSESQELNDNDLQIYRLQQTAYFSQVPQQSMNPSKRLSYGGGVDKENMAHTINKKQPVEAVSRKAMFLNKIEKEKTKKEKIEIKARVNSKRTGK